MTRGAFAFVAISAFAVASAQAQTTVTDTDGNGVFSMEEMLVSFPDLTPEIFTAAAAAADCLQTKTGPTLDMLRFAADLANQIKSKTL